ncbi:heterokaryon incompatibility protein-domain-containing protein [Xylariales sp. PMI_506]|nr:heterokaryon incompatibility protein-domain-containing protein [Xylariales sp. PMI_506]
MGQIGSSLDGKWRLPEYHPLDMGRNEIRLLTVQSSSLRKTGVEYTLEYVSLDDYTPEYADFLRQGGAELPSHHRSLVWEIITVQPEYPELADTMWEGLPPYVRKESLRQACNGKQFSGASRWVWGDFAALSYEWGDLKSPSKIVVDNISVSVTRNLSDALKNIHKVCQVRSANFRGSDATRIWVDALCINQLDIAERNLQVKRMNRIYADAGRVFIWTGPAWKNAKTFSEIMNDILVSSVEIDLPVQEGESAKATELRTWFRSIVENPIWREGMLNLMDRTYFSRLWIIQEIVLANSTAEVFFGSFSCPLSAVSASYSLIGGSFSLFVKDFPASMSEYTP